MHLYMSLSTPHLGYVYKQSRIVDAGMWLLKKWKQSCSIKELSLAESSPITSTYLYKMSKMEGMAWFKHVALVSSYQDQYVSFDSARIEVSTRVHKSAKANLYLEMARNIVGQLTTPALYRININFNVKEKSLDTFIGRAAHIQFLDNPAYIQMLVSRYPEFFS